MKYRIGTYAPVTAVSEPEPQENLSVFPNPAATVFSVSGTRLIGEVTVRNVLGQTVLKTAVNNTNATFSLQKPGVYFIEAEIGGRICIEKVVVE